MAKRATKQKLDLAVMDMKGKGVAKFELNPKVFDGKINTTLLHQVVTIYMANQRKGLAAAKTKGEVRGGGRKPWRQKGTGRARVGSIRSPLWRGGGVTFGPRPHSYSKKIPKKMRVQALKSALNAKLEADSILILDKFNLNSHKTKKLSEIIGNLKLGDAKIKFVVESIDNNARLASRNIADVQLSLAKDINAKEVLDCKKIIFTKESLKTLETRVEKWLA